MKGIIMLREVDQTTYKNEIHGKEEKTYLLVFHALWCPPCRNFKHSLEELAEKNGVNVYRVNVDENLDLPSEYGVRNLPTWFIMNPDGTVAEKVVGYKPYEDLFQDLSKYL
ncbi:thioredoxin family protein [Mycoplasma sp. HS2188]|uniref:thioredoxin family protein n=1 Tax=Mycoplasma sp. HS2188 TaxID=2976765 RepID=UPI002889B8C2|nr:thioredoxin family protein [Mycoplasma sp. HS2188]